MDQISNRTIAVKKLAEPFKSENIARHMYREVKLLKTLKHDNVRRYIPKLNSTRLKLTSFDLIGDSSERHFHLPNGRSVSCLQHQHQHQDPIWSL